MTSPRESQSGGVPVFSIGGRMVHERERLLGMTDEERRWRAQFLKDAKLHPSEPRFSPELYRATNNIFKRTAAIPMNIIMKALKPIVGEKNAPTVRYTIRGVFVGFCVALCVTYYFKYNEQDWSTVRGWRLITPKKPSLPGDADYGNLYEPKPHEYGDGGFSETFFFKGAPEK